MTQDVRSDCKPAGPANECARATSDVSAKLKELSEKATPGEWHYVTGPALNGAYHVVGASEEVNGQEIVAECYECDPAQQGPNAELIVALVNAYRAGMLVAHGNQGLQAQTAEAPAPPSGEK